MAGPEGQRVGEPDTPRAAEWRHRAEQRERAARLVAVSFLVATLAGVAVLVLYVAGGHAQLEGVALFVLFASLGLGFGLWVRRVIDRQDLTEPRYPMRSQAAARQSFVDVYRDALDEAVGGGRRRFLARLLAGAGAVLGLALLVPLRSLGPGPAGDLFTTQWRQGRRLVLADGTPVRATAVVADQVLTVFPEGADRAADSQAVLIGTRAERFDPSGLPEETVDGIVCYSKICTHAGCPVGLYRASVGELLCPCHQSTFDVNAGARVLSGPAGRALPQLPLGVDADGFLVALGDFSEPVGPSFWNMTHEPPTATDASSRRGDG